MKEINCTNLSNFWKKTFRFHSVEYVRVFYLQMKPSGTSRISHGDANLLLEAPTNYLTNFSGKLYENVEILGH